MKKSSVILAATVIVCTICFREQLLQAQSQVAVADSDILREFRGEIARGIDIVERKRQVAAIEAAFSRYTVPERARQLAHLCYEKTLGTLFMPMDLAEIALAETGGHGLSAKAVSVKGALGVWQLMPFRAKSHGFSPHEMVNDEKCADAAVRELSSKLLMARGNISRAKKLYCGVGPDADAYEAKRRQFRREIIRELDNAGTKRSETVRKLIARSS
jgi:hypothetical protein